MKQKLIILTVLLFTFCFSFSQNISGVYSSDFNELTITQNGNSVTGTYKYRSGRIEGTLNGHTLTGLWVQDNGKGKLVFEFNPDFSGYTGKWGYNDTAPSSKWNGTRIGGGQVLITSDAGKINGVFSSDFNELTITQNGNSVTGTYKHSNGRIEGTLSGRTLTGFWVQDNGKGKMIFEFNSDFSEFTGKWGFNDAAPSSKWNGKRIGGTVSGQITPAQEEAKINCVFSTDFNEMTINQSGNKITGKYKHQNGRIEGTLNGYTLTGFWYQDNGKGKMIFEFNSDFTEFTGKWGFNDAIPASKWNGKKIGGSQISSAKQQNTQQDPQTTVPKSTSDTSAAKSVKLNVDLNNEDAVVGDLKQNSVQLNVSKGTFDQQVRLQVKENGSVPQFDQKRATLIGTPFEITIDQKSKRFNKPVIVKLKLEQNEIAALRRPGDLWIGYFNGKNWDYFPPLEVNIQDEYVKFATYHFCDYAISELTKSEQINYFSYKFAVNQWAGSDNNAITKLATEQMVSEILSNKMGLDNNNLTQDIVAAIMKEDDYTGLIVSYNEGQMEEFSQNLALLAGKTICDVVTNDNNAKGLLDKVTEHSSKIGAGVNIAVALANGDGEAAAKALSMEIINTFPLTKLLNTTAELTERQINRWRNQELEAAYQVFVTGAESSIKYWGYQVEAGNFEEVWKQMRGLETKILDDAIKNYAASKNMNAGQLSTVVLDKIRKDTKENLRQEFIKRKDQEVKIESIKAENIKLIKDFETANLLTYGRFGYTDYTTFDFRLERLFRIKDMILKDTKSRVGFTGVNTGGVISAQTIAGLIQLWYSDNGKEKYRDELIKLGYGKGAKQEAAIEGNLMEGVWAGQYKYEELWLSGITGSPLLFVVYNAGDKSIPEYRALFLDVYGFEENNSYTSIFPLEAGQSPDSQLPAMLSGFRNGSFSYHHEYIDEEGDKTAFDLSALRLKTPVASPNFPEAISLENQERAYAAHMRKHEESILEQKKQPSAGGSAAIQAIHSGNQDMINDARSFYKWSPAFQRAAEKWLKDRTWSAKTTIEADRKAFVTLLMQQ